MAGKEVSQMARIARLSDELCEKYGTRNPFHLADAMGIRVVSCKDFQRLEGMYKVILNQRFVFLNGNLTRRKAGQVLAHELGHDALHREMAENTIVQDHFILDMRLQPEYEANLFAANLLYGDDEVMQLLREGKSVSEIARLLKAEEKLLELKIRILREKGKLT